MKVSIVVYKDGSYKEVEKKSAWEYENDPDYLTTINIPESPSPSDRERELEKTKRRKE